MSGLEIVAAVFGFICVYFLIQRHPWSWPTGLVQVGLYVIVFFQAKLYADMALHVAYVFLQFYGWSAWLRSIREKEADSTAGKRMKQVVVRRSTPSGLIACIAATILLTLLFSWILKTYTDAVATTADSFVAAASIVAQFLLIWRYIETWYFWIIVDVVGIWLFASRGLIATSILYALFLIMAIVGLIAWMKSNRESFPLQVES